MPEMLCIVVVDFERAMVHMLGWIGSQEEAMVVHVPISQIKMGKHCDDVLLPLVHDVYEVRGHDVEVAGVEGEHVLILCCTYAVMTQLRMSLA